MSWWRPNDVRITHLPTGHVTRAEDTRPRIWPLRAKAMAMLRGKLAAPIVMGPVDIVRCYETPDGAWTTPELDGGVHITGVRIRNV